MALIGPAFCTSGTCCEPATHRVRVRNVLGRPSSETWWLCREHAESAVLCCPRGDYIDAVRQAQEK